MDAFKTSFITAQRLPIVFEPVDPKITFEKSIELIEKNRELLKKNLTSFGGILFRGFPFHTPEDFDACITAMGTGPCLDYIGGDSPRNKIKGNIYTSTEAPPSFKIPLHNELSFVKNFPTHIYFFCQIPSSAGGETSIADCRKIYQAVDSKVKERFDVNGLQYISRYYSKSRLMDLINKIQRGHKTWHEVLETTSKQEVERKCQENDFAFKWHKNNWLEIRQTRPATIVHPKTGEHVWFNQAHLYDYNPRLLGWQKYLGAKLVYIRPYTRHHEVTFGNGKKVSRKDLYHILDVLDAHMVSFPWKQGDVLALDNVLTMHGRQPFTGKRRILTAMTRSPD